MLSVAAATVSMLTSLYSENMPHRTDPPMSVTQAPAKSDSPRAAPKIWGQMPSRMKVLYVTTLHRTGGWLAEAFAADSASNVRLEEAIGVTAGLAQLRDEVFDAVLVSHEPGVLDALELVEGLRGGGTDEPLIVLGTAPSAEMTSMCFEVGADAYCCVAETTTRSLLWTFARAIERFQLVRENRRLLQMDRQRLALEHQEAQRLLAEQRTLVAELEMKRGDGQPATESDRRTCEATEDNWPADSSDALIESDDVPQPMPTPCDLPERLVGHYREMLRAYVVMGAGNLADEMATLGQLLTDAGVSAQRTLHLHVHVLEELVGSLGNRSARHVMSRADLLVLEVMAHLADGYRRRYYEQHHPPQQLWLPGFDCFLPTTFSAAAA
jgi:DNA-binding response OmpR family regulator